MHSSRYSPAEQGLLDLLRLLDDSDYQFVTPTPTTHARVVARRDRREACDLRDVFGWSLPFAPGLLPDDIAEAAKRAGILRAGKSALRASRVRGRLFLHSAYPTEAGDSVFLGPDSYRFADLIHRELAESCSGPRIVDIGTGAGVGGIAAADCCPGAELLLTDINAQALRLAQINAAHAGVTARFAETKGLEGVGGPFDVVLANPPYIIDPEGRDYRDGGDLFGGQLSIDLAREGAERLAPGGKLILYTGSAIVGGEDLLGRELEKAMTAAGAHLRYGEIDPDVFGEELEKPFYREVERIAVVAAIATRPR